MPQKEIIIIEKERRTQNTHAIANEKINLKPSLANDVIKKKRSRDKPKTNDDDIEGRGNEKSASVAPKGSRKKKKQRSIVGAFNDRAASSTKDRRASTHVQQKEASEDDQQSSS